MASLGFNTLLISEVTVNYPIFFIKRFFKNKDKQDKLEKEERMKFYKKINTSLETIRLLAYARMSEEIEKLLDKGFATPSERRIFSFPPLSPEIPAAPPHHGDPTGSGPPYAAGSSARAGKNPAGTLSIPDFPQPPCLPACGSSAA